MTSGDAMSGDAAKICREFPTFNVIGGGFPLGAEGSLIERLWK